MSNQKNILPKQGDMKEPPGWAVFSAIPFHEAYPQSLLCNELRDAFVPLC